MPIEKDTEAFDTVCSKLPMPAEKDTEASDAVSAAADSICMVRIGSYTDRYESNFCPIQNDF